MSMHGEVDASGVCSIETTQPFGLASFMGPFIDGTYY